MTKLLAGALALAVVGADAIAAQSNSDAAAGFYALLFTPVGALPQLVRARTPRDSASRGAVDLRYGRYNFRSSPISITNFGASAELRVWRHLALGGTVARRTCDVCSGLTMAGLDARASLFHRESPDSDGGDMEIGVQLSAGYGKPDSADFRATSVTAMVPLTVSLPQSNDAVLSLSALPGVGYGRLTRADSGQVGSAGAGGTFGAARLSIGAGFTYAIPVGLSFHASGHKIFIGEAPTQLGFAVSWRL